jgi:glyoxalase family protein
MSGRLFPGVHHITAIAGNPQSNLNFYCGVLGLRLVKQTVNFDDPSAFHLYYGDAVGTPGTLLTFFCWGKLPVGRRGHGQVVGLTFSVANEEAVDFWKERLEQKGIACDLVEGGCPGRRRLRFYDPDGLRLSLEAGPGVSGCKAWQGGGVPADCFLRGFSEVTLCSAAAADSCRLLREGLYLPEERHEEEGCWFSAGSCQVRVISRTTTGAGETGKGSVHHLAFRGPAGESGEVWRKRLARSGVAATPVIDRRYFNSVYFREPGGILMEVATDEPGFLVDEGVAELGTKLQLPARLEPMRAQIRANLPKLNLSQASGRKLAPGVS